MASEVKGANTGFSLDAMRLKVGASQKDGVVSQKEKCSYGDLGWTAKQTESMVFIVNTLALNVFAAGWNKSQLEAHGLVIYGTHPFKQLACILSKGDTRRSFTTVYNMYSFNPIRSGFLTNGVSKALSDRVEVLRVDAHGHIEGFRIELEEHGVRLSQKTLEKLVKESCKSGNWENFFRYLALSS